ncbi:hypothetical protein GCM10022393_26660 [Aquimarina addita]|uniref:Transposase IS66 C-terminal domain-containing protein n=1 Tax=Aquimarina addita TaxID=870485 RepID=A0ABP6ULJ7_9FLAO
MRNFKYIQLNKKIGSPTAVQKAAILYSFFATCKINSIDPYTWLKDSLQNIQEYKANRSTKPQKFILKWQ